MRLPPTRAVGLENHAFDDLYHSVLTCSWSVYFGGFVAAFLGANALFAVAYMLAQSMMPYCSTPAAHTAGVLARAISVI